MSPSASSSSKRKHPAPEFSKNAAHPQKKSRRTVDVDNNDKGKGRDRDREFQQVTSEMTVSVAPVFAGNPRAGVEEMLDSLVMRYIPALQGVVLSHSNLTFTSDTGNIKNDCPFLICNIRFDATIWNPIMGMRLKGRINLSSPDHVSLLVHKTFNVSIPRHHIPMDEWEFEYGPAENDPEFAEAKEEAEGDAEAKAEGDDDAEKDEQEDSGSGRWVHRSTGERLGGSTGILQFTVIGLTVANEMLSLVGSIQDDPFSPAHQPYTSRTSSPVTKKTSRRQKEAAAQAAQIEEEVEDVDSEEEEDTMVLLKRKAAPAVEVSEAAEKPTKKKRKAKKEKA